MRFLDLDLDFFLNGNPYRSECDSGRLRSKYKPWSASEVRRFLEDRCGLSFNALVKGRIIEAHDSVLDFWRTLIESGSLTVPFEVIHIDAHPDLWVGDGFYLRVGSLYFDSELVLTLLNKKHIHSGNYLTFALAYGWIASLVWVLIGKNLKGRSKWDGDARFGLIKFNKKEDKCPARDLPTVKRDTGIPFKILPWRNFRTSETFDYMAFSTSPDFTPPESDELIPVVAEYMRQI